MPEIGRNFPKPVILLDGEEALREVVHVKISTYLLSIDSDLACPRAGDECSLIGSARVKANVRLRLDQAGLAIFGIPECQLRGLDLEVAGQYSAQAGSCHHESVSMHWKPELFGAAALVITQQLKCILHSFAGRLQINDPYLDDIVVERQWHSSVEFVVPRFVKAEVQT